MKSRNDMKLLMEGWRGYLSGSIDESVLYEELFRELEEVVGLGGGYLFEGDGDEDEGEIVGRGTLGKMKGSLFLKLAAGALAMVMAGGDSLGKKGGDIVDNVSSGVENVVLSGKGGDMSRGDYLKRLSDKHGELISLLDKGNIEDSLEKVEPKIQHLVFPAKKIKGKIPMQNLEFGEMKINGRSFSKQVQEEADAILKDVGFSPKEIEKARKDFETGKTDSLEVKTSDSEQSTSGKDREKFIDRSVAESYDVVSELGLQKLVLELGKGGRIDSEDQSDYIGRAKELSKKFNKLSKQQQKQALIIYRAIVVSSLKGKLTGVDYASSTNMKVGILNDEERDLGSKSSSLIPEIIESLDGMGLFELGDDNSRLAYRLVVSPMQTFNEFWMAMDSERESKKVIPKVKGKARRKYLDQKREELKERREGVAYFGSMSVEAFKEAIKVAKTKDTSFSGKSADRGDISRKMSGKDTGEENERNRKRK